jgi:hypothetical protein
MSILKNGKEPTVKELAERLDKSEKWMTFIVVPCLTTLLDEGPFGNLRGLGGPHPLIHWIIAKLRDSDATLPQEARDYLTALLEKVDFGSHRPLRR